MSGQLALPLDADAGDERPAARRVTTRRAGSARTVLADGRAIGAVMRWPSDGRWRASRGRGVERRRWRTMRAAVEWLAARADDEAAS